MQHHLSLEEEKQLVVLLAVSELGGAAPKRRVLDHIDANGWLELDDRDREIMRSRNEARWRNDVAFTRHHLVLADHLSGFERDRWAITPRGREALRVLADRARKSSPKKLTLAALQRIESLPVR
jgi:hypothetical protein